MNLNKQIAVGILIICVVILAWVAWDKFLNTGIISVRGDAPFNIKINGNSIACSSEMCETRVKPGDYEILIQKDNYEDINQKITVHRSEKLIINAELKKKISVSNGIPLQAKYTKLLNIELPLEISVSDAAQANYDKLFNMIRSIKSPRKIILQKMNQGARFSAIVYTNDPDKTYFVYPNFKSALNLQKNAVNENAAIIPTGEGIVMFDNKSYKNQAAVIINISKDGSGYAAPMVIVFFARPISADLITVSNNGKYIFAVDKISADQPLNIVYRIDIEKKSKENIAESEDEILSLSPSLDGNFVLFTTAGADGRKKIFVVDSNTRIKRELDSKYASFGLNAWTSDNKIVFVYPENETSVKIDYQTLISGNKPTEFIRIIEYNPADDSARTIYDLKGFEQFPNKIDYAEIQEYRRVMLLIGDKIYNVDYLAK